MPSLISPLSPTSAAVWVRFARHLRHRAVVTSALAVLLLGGWACGGGGGGTQSPTPPTPPTGIPAQGGSTTLDVVTWNAEWFGDAGNGPSDEALQQRNARDLIAGTDCDLWGLQEIVQPAAFNQLVAGLPGYAGLLASDALVTGGATYYSTSEQKVALIYKTSLISVQSARVILTDHDTDFAGRPPLEVKLEITMNGGKSPLYVICLHAKAGSDTTSYTRRVNASTALKTYLDTTRVNDAVLVLGDFNDHLAGSITSGQLSPYQNFVGDTAHYFTPTATLSSSIDHQIATYGMTGKYLSGSTQAFPAGQYIASFSSSTSDHLPVITRWTGF